VFGVAVGMSTDSTIIEVSGLKKRFRRVQALDGVDLSVEPSIFGLIGPNGAGKTTLLRILLGLAHPDSGEARVLGLDVQTQSLEIRRRIGVLHERPSFLPAATTIEYLQGVKRIYRSNRDLKDLLALVGLDDVHDRKISDLSAGMNQRLGIAQALIGNPELVFLDEPTSNLDVTGRDDIIRLIVDLNTDMGISFFISSHILSELEKACHNVAFIKEGKIIESGSVRTIIQQWTQRTFRVVCTEPKRLRESIHSEEITSSTVSGANTLTITLSTGEIEIVKQELEVLAETLGITIYAIEKASTLEEVYREVVKNE
jgi:ABC-2 type transport system ATP-binding protein